MKCFLILSLAALALFGCGTKETETRTETDSSLQPYDFSYATYAAVLAANVTDGLVKYADLKADRSGLDSLIELLGTADLREATRPQRFAFYINAYNILTLRSVVDAYPIESVNEVEGIRDKKVWTVAGEELTLDQIENDILRRQFSDPRVHAAISRAAEGSGPLLETPYYPEHLDSLLNEASDRFVDSRRVNQIDHKYRKATLTPIFDWFGDDFIAAYHVSGRFPKLDRKQSAVMNFIAKHLPEETANKVWSGGYEITYGDFDWGLNDRALYGENTRRRLKGE